MRTHQFWFRSTMFEIEQGEDEQTNPLCFGRQLARWLRDRLMAADREVEEVIPEDWGWCLVVQRKPFMLWVRCVSVHNYAATKPTDPQPQSSEIVWACTVVAEQPLLGKLFRKVDTEPAVSTLFEEVQAIVRAAPENLFVAQP